MSNAVIAPTGIEHGLERGAGRLLIEKRYAVGVANHSGQFIVVVLRFPFGKRRFGFDVLC